MWASKTEVGDRTAFLCVNTTAQRAHSRKKISSLLGRQHQVINLSSWVWWLLWGWSFRQALKRASLCLLICRTHWSVKTVQGASVAKQQTTGEQMLFTLLTNSRSIPLSLGRGGRKAAFALSLQSQATDNTNTGFPSKWSTEFNFWFLRHFLSKGLVPVILANYPCPTQWNSPFTDDTVWHWSKQRHSPLSSCCLEHTARETDFAGRTLMPNI